MACDRGRCRGNHQLRRPRLDRPATLHGIHNIVYWVPDDRVGSQQQLVYLLGHESREAAKESFAGFVVPPGREVDLAADASVP